MAIEIKPKITLPAGALKRLTGVLVTLVDITDQVRELNKELAQTGKLTGQAFSGLRYARTASGTGGTGGSRGASQRPPPFANAQQAMSYYAQGAANGNPFSAQQFLKAQAFARQQQRAQSAAQSFLKPGPLNGIKNAFGGGAAGGGLLGTLLKGATIAGAIDLAVKGTLQGIKYFGGAVQGSNGRSDTARAAGQLGGALGSIAGPGAALFVAPVIDKALQTAVARLQQFTDAVTAGGTAMAGAALAIGNASGVNLAAVGKSLTPYGAASLGLSPVTGWLGDMNYNARGVNAADEVRAVYKRSGIDAARRKVDFLSPGNDQLANVALMSDDVYGRLQQQGQRESIQAKKDGPMFADLAGAASLLGNSFKDLLVTAIRPLIPGLTAFAKALSKVFDVLGGILSKIQDAGAKVADFADKVKTKALGAYDSFKSTIQKIAPWSKGIFDYIEGFIHKLKMLFESLFGGGDHADAIKKNTDALNKNTQAIRPGTYGGGSQAANATPSKYYSGIPQQSQQMGRLHAGPIVI